MKTSDKDPRAVLTKEKIEERLYRDIKERVRLAMILGILGLIGLIAASIYLGYQFAIQGQSRYAVLILVGCAWLGGIVLVIKELYTVRKLSIRVKKGKYRLLHDKLVVANEKVRSLDRQHPYYPYQNNRHIEYKDEYIFESGIRYVRLFNEKDEFGLRGMMRYCDEPIPFLIVVYDEHPDAPVLLYNERVFRFQENAIEEETI